MLRIPKLPKIPYPAGTRFYQRFKIGGRTYGAVVVEKPPQVRSIFYQPIDGEGDACGEIKAYTVAFPWLTFIVRFQWFPWGYFPLEFGLAASNKPIESFESRIGIIVMPNLIASGWGRQQVCLGPNWPRKFFFTCKNMTDSLLNLYWNTTFTRSSATLGNYGSVSFDTWEQQTKLDPFFITKIHWPESVALSTALAIDEQNPKYVLFPLKTHG